MPISNISHHIRNMCNLTAGEIRHIKKSSDLKNMISILIALIEMTDAMNEFLDDVPADRKRELCIADGDVRRDNSPLCAVNKADIELMHETAAIISLLFSHEAIYRSTLTLVELV